MSQGDERKEESVIGEFWSLNVKTKYGPHDMCRVVRFTLTCSMGNPVFCVLGRVSMYFFKSSSRNSNTRKSLLSS